MSEVRGSGRECHTATVRERLRGATLGLRSGGRGGQPSGDTQCSRSGTAGGRSYPMPLSPRSRVAVGRSNCTTEARVGGRKDQPHVQGAMAVWAQEGLEELSHFEGQEGQR